MRTSIGKMILAASVACFANAGLQAATYNLKVTVPFAFQASSLSLPAGTYNLSGDNLGHFTSIRNLSTHEMRLIGGCQNAMGRDAKPRLVFHTYGRQHFLAEIWSGNGEGNRMIASREEKNLQKAVRERELSVVYPER